MPEVYQVRPVNAPIQGSVRPPGSKSLTNRALVVSALARGTSQLTGVLDSQDTRVMMQSLEQLGLQISSDMEACSIRIDGCNGRPPATEAQLQLDNSGTSIRFLTALCALGSGTFGLDGNARMRQRPIRDLVDALNRLGGDVSCVAETGAPPVKMNASGLAGGSTTVAGNISSQFLSGLLMAAPCADSEVEIIVDGPLVSQPYVDMTLGVMAKFGVTADCSEVGKYIIQPQTYQPCEYRIEPDASAASYFFAAAAITGGTVTVDGLTHHSLQGDIQFVEVLEEMGCRVDWNADSTKLQGGPLHGIDVDMNEISDTAQTLAVVAVFAEGSTNIRNIAHVRHKETDRIGAIATELRRVGVNVDEREDGVTIHPGRIQSATIETYDDHRMAMSFALLGLKTSGISIADPGCTAKTYPAFFRDLEQLCGQSS